MKNNSTSNSLRYMHFSYFTLFLQLTVHRYSSYDSIGNIPKCKQKNTNSLNHYIQTVSVKDKLYENVFITSDINRLATSRMQVFPSFSNPHCVYIYSLFSSVMIDKKWLWLFFTVSSTQFNVYPFRKLMHNLSPKKGV